MTTAVAEAPVVSTQETPVTTHSMRMHVGQLVGLSSDSVSLNPIWEDEAGVRARVRLMGIRNNKQGNVERYETSNHFCLFRDGVMISANPPLPKRGSVT